MIGEIMDPPDLLKRRFGGFLLLLYRCPGEADNVNPLSDAETFLTQLGERGEMKILPDNGHFWIESEEQKAFLKGNITEFLLREVIS